MHSPDGKKRSGADAANLGGSLVMLVVVRKINKSGLLRNRHIFSLQEV